MWRNGASLRRASAVGLAVIVGVGGAACGGDDTDAPTADGGTCSVPDGSASMSRFWTDAALDAIRADFPAPTVHARNLYHLSAVNWDVWRAYADVSGDDPGSAVYVDDPRTADDPDAARHEAIAFASHRLLTHRYQLSLARPETMVLLGNRLNDACGVVDVDAYVADNPSSAAAFGVSVADRVIDLTFDDGALERRAYEDTTYEPVNVPLEVAESGADLVDPDRWQPLLLEVALSQNGLPLPGGEQTFVGPNWGDVEPFAIGRVDTSAEVRDDTPSLRPTTDEVPPAGLVDPPAQPRIDDPESADLYRSESIEVIRASADLEVGAAVIDIGPSAFGDNSLGVDDGDGSPENPTTGEPYEPNVVDAADYYRAIAEYWADGPTSETPPGHWNSLAHEVSDLLADDARRIGGVDDPVDRLEWDVKLALALNGSLHDAAIGAWGTKAHYDSIRPISMIRWMAGNGPYDLETNATGLPLEDGLIELITDDSVADGERHEHLADHVGEIAVLAWRGTPDDPETQTAGVGWILGVDWVPYQRSTFVTPAFAGYVSGHSVFSRTGAEVLAGFTGSPYVPGGLLTHEVPIGSLLHEEGPSETFELNWATYFDAADEAGRSRIWGGIHIAADDRVGRELGSVIGRSGLEHARAVFDGTAEPGSPASSDPSES